VSWYDSSWKYRRAIAVNNIGGGAGAADATLILDKDDDDFWGNVLSSGNDVRVTDADGRTLETYDLNAVVVATRTGTIEIDNATMAADATILFWLYWGNAAASDARSAFAPAAALSGQVRHDRPTIHVVKSSPERPGSTKPAADLQKMSSEAIDVYFDVTDYLVTRQRPYNGQNKYDEVAYATFDVQAGGASQAALFDESKTYFVELPDGTFYVVCRVKAGTTGTTYTAILTCVTTLGKTIEIRARIRVKNVSEA
jgi:hypothetical protein